MTPQPTRPLDRGKLTVGLTEALSEAMAPTRQRAGGWDRGRVLVDLAVMLADGGETISDLAVLRDQPDLFGAVASTATAWRTLEAIDADGLARIAAARGAARARAWELGVDPGFCVVDLDATLIGAHSEKALRPPTSAGSGSILSAPGSTPPASSWRACCVPATPAPARRRITSPCSMLRSPSCRCRPSR